MKKNSILKITAGIVFALVFLVMNFAGVFADSTTSQTTGTGSATATIPISGTVVATNIVVTHPISVSYSIDPNANTFTSTPITIQNQTVVPVTVTVSSLQSTSGLKDALPNAYNWSTAGASTSQNYIALGVSVQKSTSDGWQTGYNTTTDYAAQKQSVAFGTINASGSGNLGLTAMFGRAISQQISAQHSIVFTFALA